MSNAEAVARYKQTEKGKIVNDRYENSAKGMLRKIRYNTRQKGLKHAQ